MATLLESEVQTMADLLERLGDISPERVRVRPSLGTATVADVLLARRSDGRLYELVDGVLVEKAMSYKASVLAGALLHFLREFVNAINAGLVAGEAGMMRLTSGLVRIPDVSFVSWARLPGGRMPDEPVPALAPDIAAEVLSPSNTAPEMQRKLGEYFTAGTLLVWIVDPEDRTVAVHTSPDDFVMLTEADVLDGGNVLPGFRLELRRLFAELDRSQSSTVSP